MNLLDRLLQQMITMTIMATTKMATIAPPMTATVPSASASGFGGTVVGGGRLLVVVGDSVVRVVVSLVVPSVTNFGVSDVLASLRSSSGGSPEAYKKKPVRSSPCYA